MKKMKDSVNVLFYKSSKKFMTIRTFFELDFFLEQRIAKLRLSRKIILIENGVFISIAESICQEIFN